MLHLGLYKSFGKSSMIDNCSYTLHDNFSLRVSVQCYCENASLLCGNLLVLAFVREDALPYSLFYIYLGLQCALFTPSHSHSLYNF